jgi:hypothetical protein
MGTSQEESKNIKALFLNQQNGNFIANDYGGLLS